MMTPNYKMIGLRIRAERNKQTLTIEKLAELSNISFQHLSHIESGTAKLSLPCLLSICNALHINTDTILAENIEAPTHTLHKNMADILADCSTAELYVLTQSTAAMKNAMRIQNMTPKPPSNS